MELDFTFEQTPWDAALLTMHPGDRISARRFLSLLEAEDDDAVESAFDDMAQCGIWVDISDLPKDYGSAEQEPRLRLEERLAQSGSLAQQLPADDLLALHLHELAQHPRLSRFPDQPQAAQDRNALVQGCLYLVAEAAVAFTGHGVSLLDLIQEGSLGLCEAVAVWEKQPFLEHIRYFIRQAMARAVIRQARAGGLARRICSDLEQYRLADRALLDSLGRTPSVEEIAQHMGITTQAAIELSELLTDARRLDLARKAAQPPKETPDDALAVEDTAYFQTRQRVAELMACLTQEEAQLLTLRFGLEGGIPASTQEICQKMGISPEEATAMEAAALGKLRSDSRIE